jgi:hypothetical protein
MFTEVTTSVAAWATRAGSATTGEFPAVSRQLRPRPADDLPAPALVDTCSVG